MEKLNDLRTKLLEIAKNYLGDDYDVEITKLNTESMTHLLQHISGMADLNVCFDYVTNSIDEGIFSTAFVKNLYEGKGYNIVLDVSFKYRYHTLDELVDEVIAEDKRARTMIKHFRNLNDSIRTLQPVH